MCNVFTIWSFSETTLWDLVYMLEIAILRESFLVTLEGVKQQVALLHIPLYYGKVKKERTFGLAQCVPIDVLFQKRLRQQQK